MARRLAKLLAATIAATAACGCAAPQLDALKRDLKIDPTERVRIYDSCRARSMNPPELDGCMDKEGFRFVPSGRQDDRTASCWSDRGTGTYPKAFCYEPKDEKSE